MSEERQPAVVDSHEGLDERDKRRLAIAGVITVVSIFVLLFIVKNNRNTDVSFVIFTIKTSLIWVIVLSLIDSFKVFDLIYAMTYGGPGTATQVMGTWMYANVFQYYHAGYGTAIAVVITVVAIAVSIPYVRSQTKEHA